MAAEAEGTDLMTQLSVLCFISEDFYYLSHRRLLLEGLHNAGMRVHLVTKLGSRGREVLKGSIPVSDVDICRESLSPFSVWRAASSYCKVIERVKPDILFPVALKPIVACGLASLMSGRIPTVFAFAGLGSAFVDEGAVKTQRNSDLQLARKGLDLVLGPLLNHQDAYTLFQNDDDAELFAKKRWGAVHRATVIRGAGLDLSEFIAQPHRRNDNLTTFLFAGRLLWDKGIKELIEACRILKARQITFRCRVAGICDPTNKTAVPLEVLTQASSSGLIEWLGERRDMAALMAESHCFVFPSKYREGVPRVLLEASSAGLALIATDMPGCRDVVRQGNNGILIPPGSSEALADAMAYCVGNHERMKRWGSAARQRAVLEYGIHPVIRKHFELFDRVGGKRKHLRLV